MIIAGFISVLGSNNKLLMLSFVGEKKQAWFCTPTCRRSVHPFTQRTHEGRTAGIDAIISYRLSTVQYVNRAHLALRYSIAHKKGDQGLPSKQHIIGSFVQQQQSVVQHTFGV